MSLPKTLVRNFSHIVRTPTHRFLPILPLNHKRHCSADCNPEVPDPIVHLPELGTLKGSFTKGAWSGVPIQQFLNIRYGQPATGNRRFKAPIPVEPWEGVLDVSKRGNASPYYGDMKKIGKDSLPDNLEDCINLCVYTKDLSSKKPVIVFIHGGGFYSGGAGQHPPEYLLEKDIVLVVPQYRLAALGFLSTKTENIPGNAGVMDVILAFRWVQKYISHFGGDPQQVTAFGQSAGAAIIAALTFSPAGEESFFNKMILNSGAGLASSWTFDVNCERNAKDIARRAGLDPKAPLEEVEKFLIELDAYNLLKYFSQHMWQGTPNGINSIGGHRFTLGGPSGIFPKTPFEVMKRGGGRKNLPMLTGVVKHEGSFGLVDMFVILSHMKVLKDKDFMRYDLLEQVSRTYGSTEDSNTLTPLIARTMFNVEDLASGDILKLIPGLIDYTGAAIIKATVLRSAQYNSRHNPDQTYVYSFDYHGEHSRFGFDQDVSRIPFDGGVHHTNDLIYLFPYPKSAARLNSQDTEIAKKMVDLWTSFAINGVPSTKDLPEWPTFNNVYGPYLHINKQFSIGHNFLDEFTVASDEARAAKK
ncbi:glutactin-like [Sabethes cyaneus]|uniref:glutactin-like n=1 Tax=Sabethes cyaneus TaxID=53552 RepID=UPI00237D4255|nr:glutactin-like [Sabethes cyaneus]